MWKDVDGVLTCDPNIYSRAAPVPYLTFDEAAELAYFGAQVSLTLPEIISTRVSFYHSYAVLLSQVFFLV